MADDMLPTRPVERQYVLDDLHVRADGTGRIVEAYCAVFNTRSEIRDQDGHYFEVNAPTSFDRTITHKAPNGFGVLFNHGRTIDGTPNPYATMPIGVPIEVKADEKGVFTATRYLDNPLADQVLDAINAGAIKAQSFSGRYTKSKRDFSSRTRDGIPTIHRLEVDMREYGPAVFAAYTDAAILGTRSADLFMRALLQSPSKVAEFLSQFEGLTTPNRDPEAFTSDTSPAGELVSTDDPTHSRHSARSNPLRDRIKAARVERGI